MSLGAPPTDLVDPIFAEQGPSLFQEPVFIDEQPAEPEPERTNPLEFRQFSRDVLIPQLELAAQAEAEQTGRPVSNILQQPFTPGPLPVGELEARFLRGIFKLPTQASGALEALGDITGSENLKNAGTLLRLTEAYIDYQIPVSGERKDPVREFVGATGESAPLFGLQIAGGTVGAVVAGPVGAMIGFSLLGAGPVFSEQYMDTKLERMQQGMSEKDAAKEAWIDAGSASLITLVTNMGFSRWFVGPARKPIEAATRHWARNFFMGALGEGTQEGIEKVLQDLVLNGRRVVSPQLPGDQEEGLKQLRRMLTMEYLREVLFEAGVGAVLGGPAGAGVSLAQQQQAEAAVEEEKAEVAKAEARELTEREAEGLEQITESIRAQDQPGDTAASLREKGKLELQEIAEKQGIPTAGKKKAQLIRDILEAQDVEARAELIPLSANDVVQEEVVDAMVRQASPERRAELEAMAKKQAIGRQAFADQVIDPRGISSEEQRQSSIGQRKRFLKMLQASLAKHPVTAVEPEVRKPEVEELVRTEEGPGAGGRVVAEGVEEAHKLVEQRKEDSAEGGRLLLIDAIREKTGDQEADVRIRQVRAGTRKAWFQRLAKRALNVDLVYVESTGRLIKGWVHADRNQKRIGRRVFVDITADNDAVIAAVAAHEIVHQTEGTKSYNQFRDTILKFDAKGLEESARGYWKADNNVPQRQRLTPNQEDRFQRWFKDPQGRFEAVASYVEDHAVSTAKTPEGQDVFILDFWRMVAKGPPNLIQGALLQVRRLISAFGGQRTKRLVAMERFIRQAMKEANITAQKGPVKEAPTAQPTRAAQQFDLVPEGEDFNMAGVALPFRDAVQKAIDQGFFVWQRKSDNHTIIMHPTRRYQDGPRQGRRLSTELSSTPSSRQRSIENTIAQIRRIGVDLQDRPRRTRGTPAVRVGEKVYRGKTHKLAAFDAFKDIRAEEIKEFEISDEEVLTLPEFTTFVEEVEKGFKKRGEPFSPLEEGEAPQFALERAAEPRMIEVTFTDGRTGEKHTTQVPENLEILKENRSRRAIQDARVVLTKQLDLKHGEQKERLPDKGARTKILGPRLRPEQIIRVHRKKPGGFPVRSSRYYQLPTELDDPQEPSKMSKAILRKRTERRFLTSEAQSRDRRIHRLCPACGGTGTVYGHPICRYCKGIGIVDRGGPTRFEGPQFALDRQPVLYPVRQYKGQPRSVTIIERGHPLVPAPGTRIGPDEIADYLQNQQRRRKVGDPTNKRDFNRAVTEAAFETEWMLANASVSPLGWYDTDITDALVVSEKFLPELKEDSVLGQYLTVLAGPLSLSATPQWTWVNAVAGVRHLLNEGFISEYHPAHGGFWAPGPKQNVVQKQVELINTLSQEESLEELVDFLFTEHPLWAVREKKNGTGLYRGQEIALSKETNRPMLGAFMFGPKVGAFIAAMNGHDRVVTDTWWNRGYYRRFNQPIQDAVGSIVVWDQMQDFGDAVGSEVGLSKRDTQAVLWYFEHMLYNALGQPSAVAGRMSDGARKLLEHDTLRGVFEGAEVEVGGPAAAPRTLEVPQQFAIERGRRREARTHHATFPDESRAFRPSIAGTSETLELVGKSVEARRRVVNQPRLVALGLPAADIYEFASGPMFKALKDAAKGNPFADAFPSSDDYTNTRTFVTEDGHAGVAIRGDEIVGAYKAPQAEDHATGPVILEAVAAGARKVDVQDVGLAEIYSRYGFRSIARHGDRIYMTWLGWQADNAPHYARGEGRTVKTKAQAQKLQEQARALHDEPPADPQFALSRVLGQAPPFRSKLREVLEEDRARGDQPQVPSEFMKALKNKGVRPEEIEAFGVDDLMGMKLEKGGVFAPDPNKTQPDRITKNEVLERMEEHDVGLRQIVLTPDAGIDIDSGVSANIPGRFQRIELGQDIPQDIVKLARGRRRDVPGQEPLPGFQESFHEEVPVPVEFSDPAENYRYRTERWFLQTSGPGNWTLLDPDHKVVAEIPRGENQDVSDYQTSIQTVIRMAIFGRTGIRTKYGYASYPSYTIGDFGGERTGRETERDLRYKEFLITVPQQPNQKPFIGPHWGSIPNTMLHMRTTVRKLPDGRSMLLIEEIQSDWHKLSREEGFEDPERTARFEREIAEAQQNLEVARAEMLGKTKEIVLDDADIYKLYAVRYRGYLEAEIDARPDQYADQIGRTLDEEARSRGLRHFANRALGVSTDPFSGEARPGQTEENMQESAWIDRNTPVRLKLEELITIYDNYLATMRPLQDIIDDRTSRLRVRRRGAPWAPFKPSWSGLAVKIALNEALREGVDTIGWSHSDYQKDRNRLSGRVGFYVYRRLANGNWEIIALDDEKSPIHGWRGDPRPTEFAKDVDKNRLKVMVHPDAYQLMLEGGGQPWTPPPHGRLRIVSQVESRAIGPEPNNNYQIIDARNMRTALGKRVRAGMQWTVDLYDVKINSDFKKILKAKGKLVPIKSRGEVFKWGMADPTGATDGYGDPVFVPITFTLTDVNSQIAKLQQAVREGRREEWSEFRRGRVARDRYAPQLGNENFATLDLLDELIRIRDRMRRTGKHMGDILQETQDVSSAMRRLVGGRVRRILADVEAPVWMIELDQAAKDKINKRFFQFALERESSPDISNPDLAPHLDDQERYRESTVRPIDPRQGGYIQLGGPPSKVKRFLQRNFTSRGDLPQDIFEQKIERDGRIGAQMRQIVFTLRDYRKAAAEVYGSGGPDASQLELLDKALKNEIPLEIIPAPMRPIISAMRVQIDAMSRTLISVGAVQGPLKAKVEENLGFYANRSYRVFDDPSWIKKVLKDKKLEDVRNRAISFLRAEFPKLDEESVEEWDQRIDGLLKNLLYEGKAAEGPIAFLSGSRLGSKDLSILMRRKEIAPEIRALWGEFQDPRINYAKSMSKMAHLASNHIFLSQIRDDFVGVYFFTEPVSNEDGNFITRIAADSSNVMYPLNGLYTTPEIKQAFEETLSPKNLPNWLTLYMKVNGFVKYSKTVLSLQTHIRNLIGNIGFAVANGHWRAWKAFGAAWMELTDLGAINEDKYRAYIMRARQLGVIHESARAGEIRDVIQEATRLDLDEFATTTARRWAQNSLRFPTTLYRAEDDVWKLFAWENEKSRYRKAYPEWTEEEVDKHAAHIVRNTYPTYSLVPRGVKFIRLLPMVGTFVSFPAEVIRTGFNTLDLAIRELNTKQTFGIGVQRLTGIMAAMTGTGMLAMASRALFGIDKEEDDDIRLFLPPWSENSQLVYLPATDVVGRRQYVDLSYTDPYEYLKKPVTAFLRGDDIGDSILQAAQEAFEPFLGEEILFQAIRESWSNKDQNGNEVWNPDAPPEMQAQQIGDHIGKALEPGTVSSMRRVIKGMRGHVELYGKTYDPWVESAAVFTGHRVVTLDVPQAFRFKAKDYQRRKENARFMITSVAMNSGPVTEQELADAYRLSETARRKNWADITRLATAAQRLGVDRNQLRLILKSVGISNKEANQVLDNDYRPYTPGKQFLDTLIKSAAAQDPSRAQVARTTLTERRRILVDLSNAEKEALWEQRDKALYQNSGNIP
jgi:hypothetical protein